jgi:4'-phosphopantetheinyl transferase EntD
LVADVGWPSVEELVKAATFLFPIDVAISGARIGGPNDGTPYDELSSLGTASQSRITEFRAGRDCARAALKKLGAPPVAIPADANGCPAWPNGYVGSITHKGNTALACVARATDVASVGIDLEQRSSSDDSMLERICTSKELAHVLKAGVADQGLLGTALFAAKEAAFKCLYPILRTRNVDFQDLVLAFSAESAFRVSVSPAFQSVLPEPMAVTGRLSVIGNLVLAGVVQNPDCSAR